MDSESAGSGKREGQRWKPGCSGFFGKSGWEHFLQTLGIRGEGWLSSGHSSEAGCPCFHFFSRFPIQKIEQWRMRGQSWDFWGKHTVITSENMRRTELFPSWGHTAGHKNFYQKTLVQTSILYDITLRVSSIFYPVFPSFPCRILLMFFLVVEGYCCVFASKIGNMLK